MTRGWTPLSTIDDVKWRERWRIRVLLAAATLIPIVALTWLALRITQQDRDIERQRRRESLEVSAGRLALDIERQLQDVQDQLAQGNGLQLTTSGIKANPALLYQPAVSAPERAPQYSAAEALEFHGRNPDSAIQAYRTLAESPVASIRGGALLRLGRVLRGRGDRSGALKAYSELVKLGSILTDGQPAGLLGRQGRVKVFEESRDGQALHREAAALAQALYSGNWQIDRATFDLYGEMLARWGAPSPPSEALLRTDAAISLWRTWRGGALPPRGRRILRLDGGPVLALWTGAPERPVVWLAAPASLEAFLRPLWGAQALAVSLYDTDGQPVIGASRTGAISLTPAETRLPFILHVAATDTESSRISRTVLIAGLLAAFLLMLAAGYGLYRATTRELSLARQQSDFVSAVSHEFRTPLTSMRHLTELLVSRAVTSEERKSQYYELLSQETERLHRMVESLLSFGRIQAGAYAWCLEPADASSLLLGVLEEFRREPVAQEHAVICDVEPGLPPISADRDALSRAILNLLENAGKYSPPGGPIRLFARRQGDSVVLGVEDQGPGIPPAERKTIFQKFVRGADAKHLGVRGVGIGLALVKSIAEAHGGSVALESEPGRGSKFTLVLPCLES